VSRYLEFYRLFATVDDLWHYVSDDHRRAVILVRSELVNSVDLRRAIERIGVEGAERLRGEGVRVSVTGTMALLNKTADAISSGQVWSLSVAFLGVALVLVAILRAPVVVVTAFVPNILPVLAAFGAMGLLGIHLTTGTSVVGSLVLGISIDDTVHYIMRYQAERAGGQPPADAIRSAILAVGRPIVFTALALCGGFAVFLLSDFAPLRAAGGLTSATMIAAVLADLVLLPAFLLTTDRGTR
jgi:predicted RND superfamily exporter protein